jgi:hypothetical protein
MQHYEHTRAMNIAHPEPPFEIWRVLPGNKALDLIDMLVKCDPETATEVDVLGHYLWQHNLIGDLVACDHHHLRASVASASDLFKTPIDAAEMYARFMQAIQYLWRRTNGSCYAAEMAGRRGLSNKAFEVLLGYECADILLEQRQRYDGKRGWTALAVIHDSEKHWQCAVEDHEGMFRRAIPQDDMHTVRHGTAELCYELLDANGDVVMWESCEDARCDVSLKLGSLIDRTGRKLEEADIQIHSTPKRHIYVEMINPARKGHLYKEWLTQTPGVMYRPLRHRLFIIGHDGRLSHEVPTYCYYDYARKAGDSSMVAQLSANMPGGVSSYGVMPAGVRGYIAPLNGVNELASSENYSASS